MSYAFDSRLGKQLYQLLPEVYRTRDKYAGHPQGNTDNEDLARYLDVHGHLLDLIHATLEQQLNDTLPLSSQDWLLPYFAQLLAVNIVSPDSDGKHAEVANAVAWRQRKGTLKVAEQIAETVGQMEAEIQEGWKRVATTPRINMPVMPVRVWDDTLDIDMSVPSEAARHPSLPAVMVDLRRPSRAVEALSSNPAARVSSFEGVRQVWRQQNRHGTPCFPGSFDDVSRRTVDFRAPDGSKGLTHHKRLLAYVPPPGGLFPFAPFELTWKELHGSLYEHLIEEKEVNGIWTIRNITDRIIEITDDVPLSADLYRIHGINFRGELEVAPGGKLELYRVEAGRIDVPTFSTDEPVLTATDCLFGELSSAGLVLLDSTTVLDTASLSAMSAKDCIFMDIVGTDITGVVEFSRIPPTPHFSEDDMTVEDCTTDEPVYFTNWIEQTALNARAVLAPVTQISIYNGASDGAEMGRYHKGRKGKPVRISGDFIAPDDALALPTDNGFPLVDIVFEGSVEVSSGTLELVRVAAKSLTVDTGLQSDANGAEIPSLNALDSLFDTLTVANGLSRLEYCTVMQATNCRYLQASDCIFVGTITDGPGMEPKPGCLRYSRIPEGFYGSSLNARTGAAGTNTRETPVFAKYVNCLDATPERRFAVYRERGYGVLDLTSPDAIRFGAEDGGEMGACHHRYYSLKVEAVLDKMREFLPVGIDPVLIQDERLLHVPPQTRNLSNGGTL